MAAVLIVIGAQAALSSPSLPPIDAEDLLASALERAADPLPISGELSATLGLGLPMDPPEDSALADVAGESRLRIERSEDGLRAALLGERSERLVVTDGRTLTTWDSRTLEATRRRLPARDEAGPGHTGEEIDPMTLSTRVLELAREHADVTVDGTARVAGRAAYRLVLAPTDEGTTLGRVEVDVDEETRVPLRTALFARGAEAASVEVAWTRVSFDPIDPATYDFTPPPGATVTDEPAPQLGSHRKPARTDLPGPHAVLRGIAEATDGIGPVSGDGFASVAVLPLPEREPEPPAEPEPQRRWHSRDDAVSMTDLLPLDGPLLSVRLTESGGQRYLLAGLVPLSRLDEVAASLPR